MTDNIWDRFCKAEGCFSSTLRNGLCAEHAINHPLEDTTWEKHMSAEEPSELYWNEVTGIGSMHDHYKITELESSLGRIKPIFEYANSQADMAQSRLIKNSRGEADLYDDTYWQPVLDRIRFDLLQILDGHDMHVSQLEGKVTALSNYNNELKAKLTDRCDREGHLSQFCESDGTPCVGEHDENTIELCFWCRTPM